VPIDVYIAVSMMNKHGGGGLTMARTRDVCVCVSVCEFIERVKLVRYGNRVAGVQLIGELGDGVGAGSCVA
jgi:hypothetical protein